MSLFKILKKAFIISALVVTIFLISATTILYFYQDEIIQKFIAEANKQLNAKIEVSTIKTNIFDDFPTISILFNEVTINGALKSNKTPLLKVNELRFSLNPINIINGQYTVKGLSISNGSCIMYVDKDGKTNYDIIKPVENSQTRRLEFELSKIHLDEIHYIYKSDWNKTLIDCYVKKSQAALLAEGDNYYITSHGKYIFNLIGLGEKSYFENKDVNIESGLVYNNVKKSIEIRPSNVNVNNSDFLVYGKYGLIEKRPIELYVENKNSSIKSIGSLLPVNIENQLNKYQSKGEVYFDLSLIGDLNSKNGPELNVKFGLIKSELIYPDKNISITNATGEGLFNMPDINRYNTANIEFTNISGVLEGKEFKGGFNLRNFDNPKLKFNFNGILDVNSLLKFIGQKNFENAKGELEIDLNFDGNINDLKKKETAKKIATSGQLTINDVSFNSTYFKLPVNDLNGILLFDNNDVAIDKLDGMYGSSDFRLKGYIKNLFSYLLLPDESLGIDAQLNSQLIDLNELLAREDKSKGNYIFRISPKLILRFKCDIRELTFRRFEPRDISGTILIKNQILSGENISFKNSGGTVRLNGEVDGSSRNKIQTKSSLDLENILLDSAFYVFENFRQTFISDHHLKGNVKAKIETSMSFDSLLNLDPKSLESTITTTIKNGELKNFEPMRRLEKYVDDESLRNVRFSDLATDIVINNETVYLPLMEIGTNISSLKLSGTHTFNQHIDYRVITPLNRNKKIDKDEAFGAIEEIPGGQSLLFLKITGTTYNYEVSYDKQAVKNKIATDLKKEVQELKDAFKNKGLNKDHKVELEEDDYFDWDEKN